MYSSVMFTCLFAKMMTTAGSNKASTSRYKRRRIMKKKNYQRVAMNALTTKRFCFGGDNGGSDAIPSAGGAKFFTLSDLPNHTEFTALFDQYMLVGVSYRWVIIKDPAKVQTAANQGSYPRIMWVHDHDSAQTPTSFAELQQYPKCQEFYFTTDKQCTPWYYVKTAVAIQMYQGIATSAYGSKWKQWIDSTYPGTQHYGLRYFYAENYTAQAIRLECKYHLKFKSVV